MLGIEEEAVVVLRRSPALAVLNPVASAHHEKCDGSGCHNRVHASGHDLGACILAATEIYVRMTTERADRPAHSPTDAAAELRRLESAGVIDARTSRAVLVAAGQGEGEGPAAKRACTLVDCPVARSTYCAWRPGA